MISLIKTKNHRENLRFILLVPFLIVILQSYAYPKLSTSIDDCILWKLQENKEEKWLLKWTSENIGKGFFQPELESDKASRKPNNILEILMNRNNEFLIENQFKGIEEIKHTVKNYLHGMNPDGKKGPDYAEKNISYVGKMKVSKGIVIFKHDLASSNEMINYTLKCIGEAFLEVKREKAQILFGDDYFNLDVEKQLAVNEAMPIWFFYEFPKSPTPNVWLPFDEKPSKPDPLKITFKGNGNVIVENHTFKTFKEFEENLNYWNEELRKFNKNMRSKGYYRVHVTYENIPRSSQKEINYLLYKNNVHVEYVKGNVGYAISQFTVNPGITHGQLEKIKQKAEQDFAKYLGECNILINYKEGVTKEEIEAVVNIFLGLGINEIEIRKYKKSAQPLFVLRLYPEEIQNVFKDVILLDAVSEYAESWLKKVGTDYSATIYVYQDVSEKHIQQLKKEMQRGGIKEQIIIKKM
ncbi:hypothetical protein [uncultured Draconibacterium sp.]|uniref:hypothetical protein n=1 Tax=uncultured Draconibacterium sp. TaxID=1573823 RepID=UPI003217BD42